MKKALFFILFINYLDAQVLCFSPVVNYTISANHPYSITSADFNGDSILDIATANNGSNNVSVLLGTGNGTFSTTSNFGSGTNPCYLVNDDFNSDSKIDLAVANYGGNCVSILLGNGSGSFNFSGNFIVGNGPAAICTSDFNADGKIDLAVSNSGSHNVSILLGTGVSFSVATNFRVDSFPVSINAADLNNDGKPDLITSHEGNISGNISVLLGSGNGSFGTFTSYSVVASGSYVYSACSGDFDKDGNLDIATACTNYTGMSSSPDGIYVLLGNGVGNFSVPVNYSAGIRPFSVINADFNGDTVLDLAVGNGGSDSVSVLIGNGDGTFAREVNYLTGTGVTGILAADFNKDSKFDIAANDYGISKVSILLNCSGPASIEQIYDRHTISVFPNPSAITITLDFSKNVDLENTTIFIQNTLGQIVKKIPFSEEISILDLAAGCYSLQINPSSGEYYRVKFIKE